MGEVRVKVHLTNAVDKVNAQQNIIKPAEVRTYEADALVDTGAVRSVLPPFAADRLGLTLWGRQMVEYAGTRKEMVGIVGPLVFEIAGRSVLEDAFVLGDEVIIGQTVLEKTDMFVDCANNRLVPNPAHPDQPVSKMK